MKKIISKIKRTLLLFLFGVVLIFIFAPPEFSENREFEDILESVAKDEVLIIFNSGGWGDTPIDEAKDFSQIIEGVKKTLGDLGYKSVLSPYERTRDSFLGRIEGARELLTIFPHQSQKMFEEIQRFTQTNPDNKIIIAGLSNGAVFVDKVMEKISKEGLDNVFAIEVGVPFWEKSSDSDNVLCLNNENEDPLFGRKSWTLFLSLFKAPIKWTLANISGREISFSEAFYFPGHDYFWDSPNIGPKTISFLKDNFSN
jgi:hypothetical protein